MELKKQRGTRPGGDARQKPVGGGKLLLPEERVTQDTYRSGNNRTEIDLLIVRLCQRNRVRDCKVLAMEHITSQHKPLVYEMWIHV